MPLSAVASACGVCPQGAKCEAPLPASAATAASSSREGCAACTTNGLLPLPLPSQTESLLKHTSEGPKFYVHTCLVVNVFRRRCMGNRLRVVICERRISAVRPCLFLPLPRRAGCARKARSAKRHFRRVRRLRLPAHGKAVQHAPRTDFCLRLCLLNQRAFSNTTARRAHVLCTCLVVNIFRRW